MDDTEKKTEGVEDITHKEPDDITSIFTCMGFPAFKTSMFIFIIFIILHSDVFVDRVLATSDNSYVEGREVTTKGILVQGILMSISFILVHILMECQCL